MENAQVEYRRFNSNESAIVSGIVLQPDAGNLGVATISDYAKPTQDRTQKAIEEAIKALHGTMPALPGGATQTEVDDALISALIDTVTAAREQIDALSRAQALRATVTDALAKVAHLARSPARPVSEAATKAKASAESVAQRGLADGEEFGWDLATDTRWRHEDVRFRDVCHLMNVEWIGIRAAAGALPGHKLVVSAKRDVSAAGVARIAKLLTSQGIRRIVVHGMSPPLRALIVALRKATDIPLFIVWHGAPVMWAMSHEMELVQFALDLVRSGDAVRMAGMRSGMGPVLGQHGFPLQLFNMPPNLPSSFGQSDSLVETTDRGTQEGAIVFVPSWHVLHKNVPTNLLAANQSKKVRQTWVLDGDLNFLAGFDTKVKRLAPRSAVAMLDTMRQVDLVTNVSIVDCHPMVELEALAVRTPCLRGPLFLDALDDHPYVAATHVANPLSVADVIARMDATLAIPRTEMLGLMDDYSNKICELSIARYVEFLEL
jgi:hypothetical protein